MKSFASFSETTLLNCKKDRTAAVTRENRVAEKKRNDSQFGMTTEDADNNGGKNPVGSRGDNISEIENSRAA